MATYAVGDVHGCPRTLRLLLARIGFRQDRDELWLVGDLVARGPDSAGALRWCRRVAESLGSRFVMVLGNHDLRLVHAGSDPEVAHGRPDLQQVLDAEDAPDLIEWLARQPLVHRDERGFLVHAGVHPSWSLDEAEARATEAARLLSGPDREAALTALAAPRGSAEDPRIESLRVLTRIRCVDGDGRLTPFPGPPEQAPRGERAWFEAAGPPPSGQVLVHGHWAALGVRNEPEHLALDSGCGWGGPLSAIRLDDRELFQVPRLEPLS